MSAQSHGVKSWSHLASDGRDIIVSAVGIPVHSGNIGRDGAKNPAPHAFSTFRERERKGKRDGGVHE